MNRRQISLFLLSLTGCSSDAAKALPPLSAPDYVRVTLKNAPLAEINDRAELAQLTAFVNRRLVGWSAPWFGGPACHVCFTFHGQGGVIGTFHVGPGFFGRDDAGPLSQMATKAEIMELEHISNLPLTKYLEGALV
jgi:hypothetical protein